MIRSMFSGISGLRVNQLKMDVIGNNIANVNTVGFKNARVVFSEVYSQKIKSATPPTETGGGGTNPLQVGLGVTVSAISNVHTPGTIQRTDNPTDLAVEGSGFFIVNDGTVDRYTRNGNFSVDEAGNLVTAGGARVMGWNIPEGGVVDVYAPLEAVNLSSLQMAAKGTSQISMEGNLDANTLEYVAAAPPEPEKNAIQYNLTIYDSLGKPHSITFKFMKTAVDNEFNYALESSDATLAFVSGGTGGSIAFDSDGKYVSSVKPAIEISFTTGASNVDIASADIVFDSGKFTQYANTTALTARQNGYPAGDLENLSIDRDGSIMGMFSNGRQEHKATIATANFLNPAGLEKVGQSMYSSTWNSGNAEVGISGTGERGFITSGSLEMSNVDLSKEFTEMIIAQRGFQANSRIISTSDELLQELVNLKR